MAEIEQHEGVITMFARAPGQVADQGPGSGAVIPRGARSGNSNFDPATGRFAGAKAGNASGNAPKRNTAAANIDPVAAQRRKDLVRRAAGLMEEFTMTTASQWLEKFGVDSSTANIESFLADVRQQRIDYLVDAMRPNLRATVDAQHANQVVKLRAPAAWVGGVMASLSDGEMLQLYQRLSGQGFDPKNVSDNLVKRMRGKKRKDALQQLFGETAGTQAAQ